MASSAEGSQDWCTDPDEKHNQRTWTDAQCRPELPTPVYQPRGTVHLLRAEKLPAQHQKVIPVVVHYSDKTLLLFEPDQTLVIVITDAVIERGD